MKQTRRQALSEAVINTATGFIVSNLAWPAISVYLLGSPYRPGQGLAVVSAFTLLSIARNYAVRRFFNRRHSKGST